ncbi:MAG TPA: hypothetical protein VKR54_00860 [Candidatus Babeliales bacterium]|jgi:hypothetical protein|nr:hypothetical protein [Candidatus Babeliales bacterium]
MKKFSLLLIALTTLPFSSSKPNNDNAIITGIVTGAVLFAVGGSIYWNQTSNSQNTDNSNEDTPVDTAINQNNNTETTIQKPSVYEYAVKHYRNNPEEKKSLTEALIVPVPTTQPSTKTITSASTESTIYLDILTQSLKNMNTARFMSEENATF